ncbi:hypothetical protein [Flectobacillus major]|uniref:hypothetical protein n=1 Tax=Flectobacillus major TaxID=103 RepID=UPI0003FD0BF1|nr:hypothetical protein [Flectobacillus major]
MELNSKKLEKTSKVIYYTISLVLCSFLILLSSKIIDDLDSTVNAPAFEQFEHTLELQKLRKSKTLLLQQQANFQNQINMFQKTIELATQNYTHEKQSFENWLATRKTLGSPSKDQEVIQRAKRLDEFYAVEQAWREQISILTGRNEQLNRQIVNLDTQINKATELSEKHYQEALKHYELKVFLIRLLFVSPVLLLGIFFFIKYRKHKFWPLFMGFSFFSLYAFFIGLVPYLPSYGGYVRSIVGILLSIGLGYYAIKKLQEYLESKRAELKTSTETRAQRVHSDIAEKALDNHICPSCGKDFILKKWEFPTGTIKDTDTFKLVTNFCRHCGLELFKPCGQCGHENFAHLLYCASCGTAIKKNTLQDT